MWYRRKAIYKACRASGGDYYGALREHACVYSLAATQVSGGPGSLGLFALSLSLSRLCSVRCSGAEILRGPSFAWIRVLSLGRGLVLRRALPHVPAAAVLKSRVVAHQVARGAFRLVLRCELDLGSLVGSSSRGGSSSGG